MAHKHVKRCSVSLAIKQVMGRMLRKGNPSALFVGMQPCAATVENSMEFLQKS